MAEGALTFFTKKMYEFLEQKVHLIPEARNEVELLCQTLKLLTYTSEDVEGKYKKNEGAKIWVSQIIDAIFQAEDIIDEFILQVEQQHLLDIEQSHRRRFNFLGCITKCSGTAHGPKVLYDIGKKINGINTKLQHFEDCRSMCGLGREREAPSFSTREKMSHVGEELNVVGMEDEANTIAKLLLEGDNRRSIVAIVGMGGLGKTTLAKQIYNRPDTKAHFQCSAWVDISQEYGEREIYFGILRCLIDEEAIEKMKDLDTVELMDELHSCLKGRRYLLVMDDIWKIQDWYAVVAALPDDKNRSRILFTTRNMDVPRTADLNCGVHQLRFLTEDECFKLMCMQAFARDPNHACLSELEEIARDIAKKCGGLPLGAVVLGGLLSMKEQTKIEWKSVLDRIWWHLNTPEHQIFEVLYLSYDDLPANVKSCFLHIGSFPEDTEIPIGKLIQIWVAEGFIEKQDIYSTLEVVAEDYLFELVQRCMIQVAEKNYRGKIKSCRIHNLLRGLAIKEAKSVKFLQVFGDKDVVSAECTTARRLAITHQGIGKYIYKNSSAQHLRSLYCFTQYDEVLGNVELETLYRNFKFLRVLHLEGVKVSTIPNEIGDLIHLRYLSFQITYEGNVRLPSKLSNLHNLQTLRVTFSKKLPSYSIYIHEDLLKMKQLRHIKLCRGLFPEQMRCGTLTNLQTLSMINVGNWVKDHLGNFTNLISLGLCGAMELYQIHLSNSIRKMKNLVKLKLIDDSSSVISIPLHPLRFLLKLDVTARLQRLPSLEEFPKNLTKIVLVCSELLDDPFPILEKLPVLKILHLLNYSYLGTTLYSSAKGFPELKNLVISSLINFGEWTMEEGAFANLKRLVISSCLKLKMIPEGLQHVRTLQELELSAMSADFTARVEEDGEDWFKIRHVPNILVTTLPNQLNNEGYLRKQCGHD